MAITEIMAVPEFGMQYQKMRINAATMNIANANVVQPSDGSGFKPMTVVQKTSFNDHLFDKSRLAIQAVNIQNKKVFQPDHMAADNLGFIHFANIDMAEQMITLTDATRAYEANIKAFNAQMSMSMKALEIGK